jgi:hypothetical protein
MISEHGRKLSALAEKDARPKKRMAKARGFPDFLARLSGAPSALLSRGYRERTRLREFKRRAF